MKIFGQFCYPTLSFSFKELQRERWESKAYHLILLALPFLGLRKGFANSYLCAKIIIIQIGFSFCLKLHVMK
jgi:hypothetical protein